MTMRYLPDLSTLRLDPARCIGCGRCVEVCPHAVLTRPDRLAVISDPDACMECGACMKNCPTAALSVQAGVGCAYAIFYGMLYKTAPNCGCGEGTDQTACCG